MNCIVRAVFYGVVLLTGAFQLLAAQVAQPATPAPHPATPAPIPGLELAVLEVKALTEQEAQERTPEFVGPNLVIRLRLVNKANRGVLLLVTKDTIDPLSCVGRPNRIARECRPKLLVIPNQWLLVPAGTALEWEEMDATAFAKQTHVVSVAVKAHDDAVAQELESSTYVVPDPIYTPKKDEHGH